VKFLITQTSEVLKSIVSVASGGVVSPGHPIGVASPTLHQI